MQRNVIEVASAGRQLRTCVAGVGEKNGKFFVTLESWRGTPGDEYLAFSCDSGAVFADEDAAYAGGARALDALESTGKYPNMCEVF